MDVRLRTAVEIRQAGPLRLAGTAVRYGDVAQVGPFQERIEPRAFQPLGDVRLDRQHDRGRPLARTAGGGLELADDDDALQFEATLADTQDARDLMALVEANVVRGASVEFVALRERKEGVVYVVERAKLLAIGVVDKGAYPSGSVEAREHQGERRRRIWL